MIGKTIKSLLAADSTLTGYVSTNIFPYVMAASTPLPAVVYMVDSVSPEYSKGSWHLDEIEFSVYSFSTDYNQLQSIASAVRAALELKTTGNGTQDINRIYLQSQDEGFNLDENAFQNKLTFRVRINTY